MNKQLKQYEKSIAKQNESLTRTAKEMNKGQGEIYQASTWSALARVAAKPSYVGFKEYIADNVKCN